MEAIWNLVKTELKNKIPGHSYRMWIDPLKYMNSSHGTIVLSSPNFFSKKRVLDHYGMVIEKEFSKAAGNELRLSIEISENMGKPKKDEPKKDRQMPLPNIDVHVPAGRLLRKGFTFDRFVVGGGNDFAYSAALSLAARKQVNQNSLYLLSDTGMGKSHLSQAIGHHILDECPLDSVYYVTAEDFTNEMVNAFRRDSIGEFKEKYRKKCDVLLLEDVHFLTGKDRTQAELAMALDYLLDADKKIIFSSCYLPSDIPKINDQLRSRLSVGLITNIEPPDFKTRVKILKKKARENRVAITPEMIEYLASELSDNVRQLESGLLGVSTKASLLGSPIDYNLARSVVKNIASKKQKITIDLIKELVCKHYKLKVEEIVSKSRKQSIVRPRQIAIYLSRKYTGHTFNAIGKSFNRYHATAIRSFNAVDKSIKIDNEVKKQISFFASKLEAGIK